MVRNAHSRPAVSRVSPLSHVSGKLPTHDLGNQSADYNFKRRRIFAVLSTWTHLSIIIFSNPYAMSIVPFDGLPAIKRCVSAGSGPTKSLTAMPPVKYRSSTLALCIVFAFDAKIAVLIVGCFLYVAMLGTDNRLWVAPIQLHYDFN